MALYTRVHTCPILSADSSFAPSFDRGFFVMARSDVAPSLPVETLIVNLIGEVEKNPSFIKKTFKKVLVRELSADWNRVCVRTRQQPDRLVVPVCALQPNPTKLSAERKSHSMRGA
jgi:hypothetical protein